MIDALTALTDLLVGLMCLLFAHGTYRDYSYHRYDDKSWIWCFLFAGISFLFGAIYHGLIEHSLIWLLVLLSFSISLVFFLIAGSKRCCPKEIIDKLRYVYATLILGAAVVSYSFNNFSIMLIVLSLGLLVVIIMSFVSNQNKKEARFLVAGIVVSVLVSVLQAAGVEVLGINNNVLFHIGLMLGLILIFYSYRLSVELK